MEKFVDNREIDHVVDIEKGTSDGLVSWQMDFTW